MIQLILDSAGDNKTARQACAARVRSDLSQKDGCAG